MTFDRERPVGSPCMRGVGWSRAFGIRFKGCRDDCVTSVRYFHNGATTMGEKTGIGWTHHTFNPWMGCNKVSEECKFCYIGQNIRRQGKEPFEGPFRTKDWSKPQSWNRKAEKDGVRRRVFTCSLSDFFHDGADEWRPEAWRVFQSCPHLDWLILTKRPELIADRLPPDWGGGTESMLSYDD